MKKVMLTLAVVAFVASLASCSKTCTCTTTTPGMPDTTVETEHKGDCSELNTSVSQMGMTIETKCE